MNFSTNGSEHAFPHLHLEGGKIDLKGGLTKREYFAARAMQGILQALHEGIRPADISGLTRDAVLIAECMITELEKKSSNPPDETL